MHRICPLAVIAVILAGMAAPALAQGHDDYTIMVPEKASKPPAHKTRHGSSVIVAPTPLPPPLHYVPPAIPPVVNYPPAVPPPVVAPSGQVLPNLPSAIGANPNGTESHQDRASRCAYQAGVYGNATGNPGAYLGACVNQ